MHAHYLQHVPFEGLGSVEAWLLSAGYEITCTKLYESSDLPKVDDVDLLLVMGGPMSVNDEKQYPWLVTEKAFIRYFIESGRATLGVCLGAQLIANALGAEVYPNAKQEIGWFPIRATSSLRHSAFKFPVEAEVFHWHGETFSLPPEAIHIAESVGCKNQAFQIGHHVIGLQFHLETTPTSTQAMVVNCGNELVPSEYIQTENEILHGREGRYREVNDLMNNVLEYLHLWQK
ncbi:type 1 glutamine amidotransferase [Teredinibacter haidensis]|uniref:type 1 glutamine amidotransferase n=1 Tax=Teredinibacter haidensis TaxID=2731755 RepID=UPI0009490D14|nr:amidotransferase [Teredinibacter haidensis]